MKMYEATNENPEGIPAPNIGSEDIFMGAGSAECTDVRTGENMLVGYIQLCGITTGHNLTTRLSKSECIRLANLLYEVARDIDGKGE